MSAFEVNSNRPLPDFASRQLISDFGFECERQIYRCLLLSITSTSDSQRISLLQQLFTDLDFFSRPNWITLIDCALKGIVSVNVSEICKCLKLNDTQKAAFLVALTDKTKSCPVAADQLQDIGLNSDLNSFNELTHYIIAQTNADNKALSQKLTKSMTDIIINLLLLNLI